jgi:hypothetical protein
MKNSLCKYFVTVHPFHLTKLLKVKHLNVLGFFLVILINATAQQSPITNEILSSRQISVLLTDSIKVEMKINFPIYRVYQYTDKSGLYYCVLTESRDVMNGEDTLNYKIKAVNCMLVDGKLNKSWELNDNIIKSDKEENSIWFWTKYTEFKDYDKDGLVEPVIIYGTAAMDGTNDGRIKILIYYKGQKVAIRHQNGILDFERETHVDQAFYTLPETIQAAVRQKMELMKKNDVAIFPHGWQTAMKNKKLVFNERK